MLGATFFAIHGLQSGQSETTNAEFGIQIPDLDQYLAEPVREYPWARAATFLDPLGN
jgi:hypothetical protein